MECSDDVCELLYVVTIAATAAGAAAVSMANINFTYVSKWSTDNNMYV